LDGVIGDVSGEMILTAVQVVRSDVTGVAHHARLVLRGFACEEAVKIFEADAGGPVVKRAARTDFRQWGVVPFAPGSRAVAIVFENFRGGGAGFGNHPAEAIPVVGELGDLTVADAGVVAT